jgi:DNA/RNA endonuclease G (NUC1)
MCFKSVIASFWLAVGVFLACPAYAIIDAALQMQLGNPSGATADTNNHDHYLIQRTVEALDYSDNLGQPVWASWDLTAADLGTNARSAFITDTNLPNNFYRVTDNDYNGVGNINFARGHLCPSADRNATTNDNRLVFYMSNIMPQASANNSGIWGQFEGFCRGQTVSNEVLIICGPSGFGTNKIPSGKAYIADYTWKVAVFVPTNSGTALSRINNSTRVISLKVPNSAAATNTWPFYVTSARQIEVDTGFTFFTALPAPTADVLRNKVDGQTNPPPMVYVFSPASGAAGASVVITGTNFTGAIAVTFNGYSASFTVNSNSQLTTVVPPNGNSGFISVTTPSGTATSTNDFVVIGGVYSYTGTLVGWDMSGLNNGLNNYGPSPLSPTTNAIYLTVTGLTRGSGVTQSGTGGARGWGGTGFTSSDAASAAAANQFATFSVTPNAGVKVSFTAISRFDYRRSNTGPPNGVLQYQIGSGLFTDITNLNYTVNASSVGSFGPIDLSGFPTLQNVGAGTNVTFRIVNYLGSNAGGTWYVYDVASSTALDFAVQGTVTEVITPITAPGFQGITLAGGQISLSITGAVAASYTISATTNLVNPQWLPLLTTNPAALPFTFVDTNRLTQRFYRVQNP